MELEEILYLIGQGFGIIAIALGFISYQMKTQGQVLVFQLLTCAVFFVHYGLIGATTAMAMNGISIIRCAAYYIRNKKGSENLFVPIFFTALVCLSGILTWEAWYSVFAFVGIGTNAYCMSLSNAQTVRKTILITCPIVIIYDVFALSIGGIIYESVAMISALIGIFRMAKKNSNTEKESENGI